MNSLGSFSITPQDSLDFARASGDFNPLHLDAVAARRTRFGHTLIHGVCGTLRALDLLLKHEGTNTELVSVRVKYSKPVKQGQEVTVQVETLESVTRLELSTDGVRCQTIELELVDQAHAPLGQETFPDKSSSEADTPVNLNIGACPGLSGAVDLYWDSDLMAALFPNAVRYLPAPQLATIIASTQVVGMRCPGLHSVFAQLELRFSTRNTGTSADRETQLAFSVLGTDPRIDRVELALSNAWSQGTVEAFFRPPPVQQASFKQILSLVADGEFSDQNALVIGASRGLGEVISKVLAAGGATLMMTYAAGKDDAVRVAREIGQQRTAPTVCFHDVLEGSLGKKLIEFCASVTHIYYLASPTIARGDSGKWDRPLFAQYCDFYIDGLATLLQQITQHGVGNRAFQLFIPSSIFLEQSIKGFDEYIAAKAVAEAYVHCYEKTHRNCTVVAPRLPRLHTDQTSSIRGTDNQQTLKVIVDQLRLKRSSKMADDTDH
jgi:acyl dehydratase/NAD(P)-dependent dehydrogenase (short-subunit alcohol dehydrogenase family)